MIKLRNTDPLSFFAPKGGQHNGSVAKAIKNIKVEQDLVGRQLSISTADKVSNVPLDKKPKMKKIITIGILALSTAIIVTCVFVALKDNSSDTN